MGGACGFYGGEERLIKGFGGGHLGERGHLEDLSVEGNILKNWVGES